MDLKTAKQIFMQSREAEGVTIATYKAYNITMRQFLLYLYDKDIYSIDQLDAPCIREFLISVKARGVRNISVHKDFRVIRTFCLFLFQNDYVDSNPMANVKAPKVEKRIIRTFTAQEIKKLLSAFDTNDYFGMRNYCMMSLLFSTGIRKAELCNIRLDDINVTTELIRIRGKGQKERFVPIGRTMKRTLKAYLVQRDEFVKRNKRNSMYLYVSAHEDNLTVNGVGGIFYKLKKALKIPGERINCHTWRHTFAKNYLLNGGDIFSLQKILGHAELESTKIYLNLNTEEMKQQHAKYNPLDNSDWLL